MSADNWTFCPQCRAKEAEAIKERRRAADEAYGKVSPAEWRALDEAARLIPEPRETLREDWDIGIHEGKFSVDYGAGCAECGFRFTFTHEGPTA